MGGGLDSGEAAGSGRMSRLEPSLPDMNFFSYWVMPVDQSFDNSNLDLIPLCKVLLLFPGAYYHCVLQLFLYFH